MSSRWAAYLPTEREKRAHDWERRRHDLLGGYGEPSSVARVAKDLGLSVRTLQRYEWDGAPAWYELALIGLAHARRAEAAEKRAPQAVTS